MKLAVTERFVLDASVGWAATSNSRYAGVVTGDALIIDPDILPVIAVPLIRAGGSLREGIFGAILSPNLG